MRPEDSTCIGVVAHIFSASPGGPRGTGGLTRSELSSPANAIWLCSDHAALVDKNRGTDYPPGLLLSFKSLHEARIAREMEGLYTRFGWVEALHVHSSPLFEGSTKLELGKLTLLIGENGTGKTALCEWLAAASSARYLKRWQTLWSGRRPLDVEVCYLDPEPHSARVSFLSQHHPHYVLDGEATAISTASLRILFPGKLRFGLEPGEPDDLDLIAKVLRLEPLEVLALCEEVSREGTDDVRRLWFEQDPEDGNVLQTDVKGTHAGLPFRALSGSECIRVLMELCIIAANRYAKTQPTILILDAGAWNLDTDWLERYGEFLSSPAIGFQTIASLPTRNLDLNKLRWAGWKVFHLEGVPPHVALAASIRGEEG